MRNTFEAGIAPQEQEPERLPFILAPDETSLTIGYDVDGVREENRIEPTRLPTGHPVINHPFGWHQEDAICIGPKLGEDEWEHPERCQDRVALHYDASGLDAFAVADGVTNGFFSAGYADTIAREACALLAQEAVNNRTITSKEAAIIISSIRENAEATVDEYGILAALRTHYSRLIGKVSARYLKPTDDHPEKIAAFFDEMMKRYNKSLAATTLITGSVDREFDPKTKQVVGERITVIRFGDGGTFVVGPDGMRSYVEKPTEGAPPQLLLNRGQEKSPINEENVMVNEIILHPGEILFVCTDGLEKHFPSLDDAAVHAQELYKRGVKNLQKLAFALLQEAKSPDEETWRDDTTIVAHECRA